MSPALIGNCRGQRATAGCPGGFARTPGRRRAASASFHGADHLPRGCPRHQPHPALKIGDNVPAQFENDLSAEYNAIARSSETVRPLRSSFHVAEPVPGHYGRGRGSCLGLRDTTCGNHTDSSWRLTSPGITLEANNGHPFSDTPCAVSTQRTVPSNGYVPRKTTTIQNDGLIDLASLVSFINGTLIPLLRSCLPWLGRGA